jgi:hypothetical protein
VPEMVTVNLPGPAPADRWDQDQSEWQIEWQPVLAGACLGLADAGLCSRSAWSPVLPAVTESDSHLW